jgi:acetyl esterase/lipase
MKRSLALFVLIAGSVSAFAQPPAATPMPTPTDPDAIVLNAPAQPAAQAEQWETQGGNRSVRNVTTSTLTPFLPDPAKATGASVIVAPGGGYIVLSIDNEGYDVCHWLAAHGVAAFLLKYRLNPTPADPNASQQQVASHSTAMTTPGKVNLDPPEQAVEDARAAVRLVRARARQWHVDPARIGFTGFSAGAGLTVTIGLDPDAAARPDFIAPVYGSMRTRPVPAYAPPMFFAVAADDPIFGGGDFSLISDWRHANRPVEFHYFEHGGHGFGMSHKGTTSDMWIEEFYTWMKSRGLLAAAAIAKSE